MNSPGPVTVPKERLFTRSVASWALYDLANTIFSMNIVSLYLAIWVVNVMGGSDATWGYTNSFSMLLVLLTAPFLGALSDQAGRRLPFLLITTLICVGFTFLLGLGGLDLTLIFFVIANYFYQAGLIFYDATLASVSTPETRGRIGGIGISLGYLGSFIGVAAGLFLLETRGHVFIFRLTAALFLVFSIPIFLFVKEPVRVNTLRLRGIVGRTVGQVKDTVRHVGRYRGLGRFLIGRVFYADAANTVIIFMSIYVTAELGYTDTMAQMILLVAITAAVIGAFALGFVVDRLGPKRTLDIVLGLWVVALSLAALIPLAGLPTWLFWGVGCMAGIALGGTWTADRPYMLVLTPPARIGEFYGLYSLVGRFAAVLGPFIWAFVVDTVGLGRPFGILSLLVMVVVSYVILRGVDDAPREWGPEDMVPVEA